MMSDTGSSTSSDDLISESARLLAEGDDEAALGKLQEAGAIDPESLRFQFLTGLLAWRFSNLEQALALLRRCHDLDPMNGTVAEVLASLVAQAGDLVESLYFGKIATALGPKEGYAEVIPPSFPSFGEAFLAIQEKPLFARAKLMAKSGQLPGAIDFASQHVSLNPADDEARRFLADLLLRIGASGAALATLAPAAERAATTPEFLSRYARALSLVGDHEEARRYHDAACKAAPSDASVAAARVADSLWLDSGVEAGAARAADWASRFLPARKAGTLRREGGKLVIGYLVSCFADPLDAAAVAAVAKAHDRSRFSVIAFGLGQQSWAENAMLSGAFNRWRDISDVDPATLARVLRGEGLAVVIDCAGFANPSQLLALARVNTALRVGWLGAPPGLGAPFYDAVFGRSAGDAPAWGADRNYPLIRDWIRPITHNPSHTVRFGGDVGLRQLDPATVRLWSAVLAGVPGANLALRAHDMERGSANIDRLIARFGRDVAARIDIVEAMSPEDFYRDVDIALAPLRGSSPRMAAEAIACGVPVVALAGGTAYEPYGAFMRGLGLGDRLVAADERDYISIAQSLAGSADARAPVIASVAAIARAGEASARGIAESIETNALKMLAEVVGS